MAKAMKAINIDIRDLEFNNLESNKMHRFWVEIMADELGHPILLPVLVAKGKYEGKTVGITAAVHGDELNGIPVIQKLFQEFDTETLSGTIVGMPVVNVLAFADKTRRFDDGTDLNRIMPGKPRGNTSEVYAHRILKEIVMQFDYLIDLHTASFGRVNSYYIRANMSDKITAKMAYLQNAQIIVHNASADKTLRGAAEEMGIHAITLEVGNPNVFQKWMIHSGLEGIHNTLVYLEMKEGEIIPPSQEPVFCKKSYWIHTSKGGILRVTPEIATFVKKDKSIATQNDIFGDKIISYIAPENGIVIGKSISPVNKTGGRILHLGIVGSLEDI